MRYPATESPVVKTLVVTMPGRVRTRYGACELDGPCSVPGVAEAPVAATTPTATDRATAADPRMNSFVLIGWFSSRCARGTYPATL
jgi:hypothetical protein